MKKSEIDCEGISMNYAALGPETVLSTLHKPEVPETVIIQQIKSIHSTAFSALFQSSNNWLHDGSSKAEPCQLGPGGKFPRRRGT